jgi:hypothetical protein
MMRDALGTAAAAAAAAALAGVVPSALAAEKDWKATVGSGNWSTASNWTPSAPAAFDDAFVVIAGSGAITDQNGLDAFRNLAAIGSGGVLKFQGHNFTAAGALANDGQFTQTAGGSTTLQALSGAGSITVGGGAGSSLMSVSSLSQGSVHDQLRRSPDHPLGRQPAH